MPRYVSSHRPEIDRDDLAHVTHLLSVFDKITFNGHGELVALMTVDFPVIGEVIISLYDRENHIQVQRPNSENNGMLGGIWNGYLHELIPNWEPGNLKREDLIIKVRAALRDKIAKELV